MKRASNLLCLVLMLPIAAVGQTGGIITTVAGGGPNNMPALSAGIGTPQSIVLDPSGSLYLTSFDHSRVFKVDASGQLTVFAGHGSFLGAVLGQINDGGPATNGTLRPSGGLAFDAAGNLFIADPFTLRIRRVDAVTGIITTVAGSGSIVTPGFGGDGGLATAARLNFPSSIAFDALGRMFIADANNLRIRMVVPGADGLITGAADEIITTVAGNGTRTNSIDGPGGNPTDDLGDGGPATSATFNDSDQRVIVDSLGNLFVSDRNNGRVRYIDLSTNLITSLVLGVGPEDIVLDTAENLFIADGSRVFRRDAVSGSVTSVIGTGVGGFTGDGGSASNANVRTIELAFGPDGSLYLGEITINRVRRVVPGSDGLITGLADEIITTVAGNGQVSFSGDGFPARDTALRNPSGVAFDIAGNMFIADWLHNRIRRVDAVTGLVSTLAGDGVAASTGDGGLASAARVNQPFNLALDAAGSLYFAELAGHRVRRIDAGSSVITTVAGTGLAGFAGDGWPATAAQLNQPNAIALDVAGNLYIADTVNQRIRRVDAATGIISTFAGNGVAAFAGDGGPATAASLRNPVGVVVDSFGSVFIADIANNRVRRVDASGTISSAVVITFPRGLLFALAGSLFVSTQQETIRRVSPGADGEVTGAPDEISTFIGGGCCFNGDGIPAATARMFNPRQMAFRNGTLYFADAGNHRIRSIPFNSPPVADAGADQTITCANVAGTLVTLDGSGSSDPDLDTLSYEWRDASDQIVGTTASVNLTLPLGNHTFTLTVSDGHGGTATDSVTIAVQDTTPPSLTLSTSMITVVLPTATATSVAVDLSGIASATDSCDDAVQITHNAPALFPIGATTVTFTATDDSGNSSQAQLTVHVVYQFSGFLPPIRSDGSSVFKSGRVIPVKFQLTAADGSVITNANATIQVFKITDVVMGTVEEVTPEAAGASNTDNIFRFDPTTGLYTYNLSTTGYSEGTYILRALVNDQTLYEVLVSIRP